MDKDYLEQAIEDRIKRVYNEIVFRRENNVDPEEFKIRLNELYRVKSHAGMLYDQSLIKEKPQVE